MSKKAEPTKKSQGFIHLPLLIAVLATATILGVAGEHYVNKQIENRGSEQLIVVSTTTAREFIKNGDLAIKPITHFMKQEATGQDVCILQEILKKEGVFDDDITCYYGSKTHWAVSKLLYKYGYSQTTNNFGNVDEVAMNLVNRLYIIDGDGVIQKNMSTNVKIIEDVSREYSKNKKEEVVFEYYKTSNKPSASKEIDTDFSELIVKAKEKIKNLELDKNGFLFLRETVNDHHQKSIEQAIKISSEWVNLAKNFADNVPTEYKQMLLLRNNIIVSDQEWVKQHINSIYGLLDLYFWNSNQKQREEDIIANRQNTLAECIELWTIKENDLFCEIDLWMSEIPEYSSDFAKIAEKLVEIDNLAFESINNLAKRAEDGIADDLDSISRNIDTMYIFQSEMNRISQQLPQKINQLTPSNTNNLTCKYPTDNHILVVGKGWQTVKQCDDGTYIETSKYKPDTSNMTPQQICDARKASWFGSGALVNTPDCSDLGL